MKRIVGRRVVDDGTQPPVLGSRALAEYAALYLKGERLSHYWRQYESGMRVGQALFNCLDEDDQYRIFGNPLLDPYYDDDNIQPCIEHLNLHGRNVT